MLRPSIFNHSFTDDFFNDIFSSPFGKEGTTTLMNTDIQDLGDAYQLEVELPGYDKSDVKAHLEDGYLTITANKEEKKEEKGENGKYIRKERYSGSCQRSFYVGEGLREEDVKASFENGILKLSFPKQVQQTIEKKKYISIE